MSKRHSAVFVVAFLASFMALPCFGSQPTDPKAQLKGFSEFITKVMAEWKVPGMAVAIVKDGKVIFAEGFGFRDVERGLIATPHTIFPIASCTKAFTAAGVGILVDEGKVGWDEPVRMYLPDFKLQDEYTSAHCTLRDLLCHRSGMPRHDLAWMGGQVNREELMSRLRYLELSKPFRSTWQYTNLMYTAVGYLTGKVDGSSWEDFTQRTILNPLGMKGTKFSNIQAKETTDFSWPYWELKGRIERMPFRDIPAVGPSGSIISNVMDMAKWILLNLNKGKFAEKQIISEASMVQLHSPQMIIPGPIKYDEVLYSSYGMGWFITSYRGHLMVWHGGGTDGFVSQVTLFPRENFGLVVLSNLNINSLPSIVSYNIVDRLFGLDQVDWNTRVKDQLAKSKAEQEKAQTEADKDRKLNTRPSHPLAEYAGDYENPGYGIVTIVNDGDSLTLKTPTLKGPLSHYHYDVFNFMDSIMGVKVPGKVVFATDLKGNISGFSLLLQPTTQDVVYTRIADKGMTEKKK